jgi:hypothetical protein
MKKSMIIFTVVLSVLSFSSCKTKSGELEEVVTNTPKEGASIGGDKRLIADLDSDAYKDVTYEINSCVS